jgi:hypothetical protein
MQALRKAPIKFTFNNVKYNVAINNCVPAKGYVNVLAISPIIVDENTDNPAIRIYVQCNKRSQQPGRQYALFYNINKRQFDGNFTVN